MEGTMGCGSNYSSWKADIVRRVEPLIPRYLLVCKGFVRLWGKRKIKPENGRSRDIALGNFLTLPSEIGFGKHF